VSAAWVAGLLPLLAAACVTPVRHSEPSPGALRLRVTTVPGCPDGGPCSGSTARRVDDGRLLALGDDTLTLDAQGRGRVIVPIAGISRLEVYRGRAGSAGTALMDGGIGALVGAGVAALAAGLWGEFVDAVSLFDWNGVDSEADVDIGRAAVTGAIAGAAVGVVYGATAGTAVWEVVTVDQLRHELTAARFPNARLRTDPVAPARQDAAAPPAPR